MACDWRRRESEGVRWPYVEGDMEASRKMSMRRPHKIDTWRFLDDPTWWATREELD